MRIKNLILISFLFICALSFASYGETIKKQFLLVNLQETSDIDLTQQFTDDSVTPDVSEKDDENDDCHEERNLKFNITDDFRIINNHDSFLEFTSHCYNEKYSLDDIKSLGILTEYATPTGVDTIDAGSLSGDWCIYDIHGVIIDRGEGSSPAFSKLERGQIYIIVANHQNYRYVRLK